MRVSKREYIPLKGIVNPFVRERLNGGSDGTRYGGPRRRRRGGGSPALQPMRKVAAQPSRNAAVTRRTPHGSPASSCEPLHWMRAETRGGAVDVPPFHTDRLRRSRPHRCGDRARPGRARGTRLASLDPIEAYEDFLFFPESAQPDRAEQRAEREEAPVQLSLLDGESDEPAEARGTGAPSRASRPEALPSSVVPLIVASGDGCGLAVAHMAWGYEVPWKNGPVFNTRIETALRSEGSMWAESFARRRCLVPARGFYESHATETVPSERTGRPVKRQYAFAAPDGRAALAGGRARSRTILARHHRAERRRVPRPQPHAARAGTGRGRPMAARRLRAAARPKRRAADRASRA